MTVPLAEGHELMGVFELTHPAWTDELLGFLEPVVRLLALVVISKRRYTDVVHRTRRVKPLSVAAEMQWDLLPPLACTTACVSVSGILEPAYSIGGDSFDYAMNEDRVGFAVVDAVGHGMPAVLLSSSAINCLRNARREGRRPRGCVPGRGRGHRDPVRHTRTSPPPSSARWPSIPASSPG